MRTPKETPPSPAAPATTGEPETVLVIRTVTADMKCCADPANNFHKPFTWPESGPVAAPDWDPKPVCGQGLHGLLNGEGDWRHFDWGVSARALILRVEKGLLVDLGGKVKFPRAIVESVSSLATALCHVACDPSRVGAWIAEVLKSASGNASKLAASGYASQLAASGDASQLAASGYASQLAASGYASIVVSAGFGATASAGANGAIALAWWDGKRPRISVAYVGESGIEPNVAYRLHAEGRFVRAS